MPPQVWDFQSTLSRNQLQLVIAQFQFLVQVPRFQHRIIQIRLKPKLNFFRACWLHSLTEQLLIKVYLFLLLILRILSFEQWIFQQITFALILLTQLVWAIDWFNSSKTQFLTTLASNQFQHFILLQFTPFQRSFVWWSFKAPHFPVSNRLISQTLHLKLKNRHHRLSWDQQMGFLILRSLVWLLWYYSLKSTHPFTRSLFTN